MTTAQKRALLYAALFPLALAGGLYAANASSNDVGFQREKHTESFSCPYFKASVDAGEMTYEEYRKMGCS